MSLQETLARGRDALKRSGVSAAQPARPAPTPAPAPRPRQTRDKTFFEPVPLIDPVTLAPGDWREELQGRMRDQLRAWIDAGADFIAERQSTLAEMARTSVAQPSDYEARHAEVTLTGQPLSEADQRDPRRRRALVVDTLARWAWMQRRAYPMHDYGGPYKALTQPDAEVLAAEVLAEEVRRRKP